jgi:hypothetical protein
LATQERLISLVSNYLLDANNPDNLEPRFSEEYRQGRVYSFVLPPVVLLPLLRADQF